MAQVPTKIGTVVIGRNEGERLKRCLKSLSGSTVVYVDSGSTDGSAQWAHQSGVELVELGTDVPFTAGRARNAGFQKLAQIEPNLLYVQFVDGDCELVASWFLCATKALENNADVGIVSGLLHERFPLRSVYNWLCSREWQGPIGDIRTCGGIAMMRATAFKAVGGFRDDIIAGEEPELCVRLRAAGWRIWRIDADMALHDAAMTRFSQWWRRATRGGYGFALGSHLHGAAPERHFVWESRRAWLWGVWLPLGCVATGLLVWPWGWLACLIYPLQVARQAIRNSGTLGERATLAFFQTLAHFPEALGQIKFVYERLLGRRPHIIEYK